MENEEVWLEIRKGGDFEAMAALYGSEKTDVVS